MAWTKEYASYIETLEDNIALVLGVCGFLETRALEGDTIAAVNKERLRNVYSWLRVQRQKADEQLILPGFEHDGKED
jgi:hypothetical protein